MPCEHARGDAAGRLQLVVVDREPERAQLLAELRARHDRRVRDEADPVAGRAQPPHRVDGAGDRLAARRAARRPRRGESPPWTPSLFGRKSRSASRRSSGPGGQHAQKSSTRVEALFDVEGSEALTAAERRRVLERLGPVVRAIAQDERSQLRNRELATDRIVEQLREATRVRRPRRADEADRRRRSERRLESKRRQSETKRLRRPPDD